MLSKWTMTEYQRSSFKASCLRELAPRAHHTLEEDSKETSKHCKINTQTWETTASDRTCGRKAVNQGLKKFDVSLAEEADQMRQHK